MTYSPTVYDWRADVQPVDMMFRAGGLSIAGGMTLGGASVENPEPGGRGELFLNFSRFALPSANLNASWTISRIMSGAVMRIRLWTPSVQIVSDAALGITSANGVLWANGLGWAGDIPWRADPSVRVTVAAAKGAASLTCAMTAFGQVLSIGHIIGIGDVTHIVTDIAYNAAGTSATLSIQPPLRKALTTTDRVKFRPTMLVTCTNPREVADNFRFGQTVQLNSARLVEALV